MLTTWRFFYFFWPHKNFSPPEKLWLLADKLTHMYRQNFYSISTVVFYFANWATSRCFVMSWKTFLFIWHKLLHYQLSKFYFNWTKNFPYVYQIFNKITNQFSCLPLEFITLKRIFMKYLIKKIFMKVEWSSRAFLFISDMRLLMMFWSFTNILHLSVDFNSSKNNADENRF